MSDLPSNVIPVFGTPDAHRAESVDEVIELCRNTLALAERGELRAVAVAFVRIKPGFDDEGTGDAWASEPGRRFGLHHAINLMAYRYTRACVDDGEPDSLDDEDDGSGG